MNSSPWLTLLGLAVAAQMLSCSGCNDPLPEGESIVELGFGIEWDGEPFTIGESGPDAEGRAVQLERFECYVSDFAILDSEEGWIDIDTVARIDFSQANPFAMLTLPGDRDRTISAIRMGLGVPADRNVDVDPASYDDPDHPLGFKGSTGMHWGWASGYRFLAFEGYSGDELSNQSQVHALGDANFFHQSHPVSGESVGNALALALEADYAHLFVDLPLEDGFFVHGAFGAATQMMANMRDLVFEPGTATKVERPVASEIRIFPNPTTEFIYIDGAQFCKAERWVIYDAAGKSLVKGMVSPNEPISIQHLQPGVYHIFIDDTRGTSIAAHRFLKL